MLRSWLRTIPGAQASVSAIRQRTRSAEIRRILRRVYPVQTEHDLIRFGPDGDGGYLIPDDLKGIAACFSPGVSSVSGFELDCAKRGMRVFLADASVEVPAEEHELFHFTKKFIGSSTDEAFVTLNEWVASTFDDDESDLLLQIDIEGHEYEVFAAAPDELMLRFRIIVAEFHYLNRLLEVPATNHRSIIDVFDKLLNTHSCVHIHPNNCCGATGYLGLEIPKVVEFTFLRNDRIASASFQTVFPQSLDRDNTAHPTMALPECWYHPGG